MFSFLLFDWTNQVFTNISHQSAVKKTEEENSVNSRDVKNERSLQSFCLKLILGTHPKHSQLDQPIGLYLFFNWKSLQVDFSPTKLPINWNFLSFHTLLFDDQHTKAFLFTLKRVYSLFLSHSHFLPFLSASNCLSQTLQKNVFD